MNLHQIVSGAISSVNPFIDAQINVFAGETENASGVVTPSYEVVDVTGQLQPVAWKDLQQLDGMNITGVNKKFYVNGNYSAISRITGSGGDFIIIDGKKWMIPCVLELWPDWCALALREQLST
ncbi:hypothetical protein [Pantoea sp.]|uniref:hypothetical protein n=1 Tax=Pantoea sp. TaxID=69393 RepID=UPI0028B1263B|nr:hypothetical protein [Pantoea sp.]